MLITKEISELFNYLSYIEIDRITQALEYLDQSEVQISNWQKRELADLIDLLSSWRLPISPVLAMIAYYIVGDISKAPNLSILFQSKELELASQLLDLESKPYNSSSKDGRFSKSAIDSTLKLRELYIIAFMNLELLLLYLANRVLEARLLKQRNDNKAFLATELNSIIPLFGMCGMWKLGREVSDISLEMLNPRIWNEISEKKQAQEKEYAGYYAELCEVIKRKMSANGMTAEEIKVHSSSISGIYRRMRRGEELEALLQQIRIDITVKKQEKCYDMSRILSQRNQTIKEWIISDIATKDLFASPKFNGYRCLITTITYLQSGIPPVEFRICDKRTEEINQDGIIAAKYREGAREKIRKAWWDDDKVINFVRSHQSGDSTETIYVLSPKGQVFIDLPQGSTPVDYAYLVHSNLAHQAGLFLVNGQWHHFDTQLQNGSIVEIKTDSGRLKPPEEWLPTVKTAFAKRQIKSALNKYNTLPSKIRQSIDKVLSRELKAYRLPPPSPGAFNIFLEKLAREYGCPSLDALYVDIDKQTISRQGLRAPTPDQIVSNFITSQLSSHVIKANNEATGFRDNKIKFRRCSHNNQLCRVVPGTPIIGRIHGVGPYAYLIVYRKDCENIPKGKELIELTWRGVGGINRAIQVLINAIDAPRLLNQVLQCVYDFYHEGIYLQEVQASVSKDNSAHIELTLTNNSVDSISRLHKELIALEDKCGILSCSIEPLSSVEQVLLIRGDDIPNPYSRNAVQDIRLFKGRHDHIKDITTAIKSGNNFIVIQGASRVGKTSLLNYLHNYVLLKKNSISVLIDNISEFSESKFWQTIAKSLRAAALSQHGDNLDNKSYKQFLKTNEFDSFRAWLAGTQDTINQRDIIFLMDEFTSFDLVQGWYPVKALEVISKLKLLVESLRKVSFIVTVHDSVYQDDIIAPFPSKLFLGQGVPIYLDHLSPESAERLIREPMEGFITYEDNAVEQILNLTNCHPFYLQILLFHMVMHVRNRGINKVCLSDINSIIPSVLKEGNFIFAHFLKHPNEIRRFLLVGLAELSANSNLGVSAIEVHKFLERRKIVCDEHEVLRHLEDLCAMRIIESQNDQTPHTYSIRIPLFKLWLSKNSMRLF